jgi:hypothetical protein
LDFEMEAPAALRLSQSRRHIMSPTQPSEAPPFASLPQAAPPFRRITIPLHRVLGIARRESESRPSRRLGFAMRPLLSLALETTGLYPGLPVTSRLRADRWSGKGGAADPEVLFTALSSLVEVVKTLTPSAGRVYAQLGHQAVPVAERRESGDRERGAMSASGASGASGPLAAPGSAGAQGAGGPAAAAPRSEVVIELVSTDSSSSASFPSSALPCGLGGLALELAVVAAIVESRGGELCFGSEGADTRSFVVRLPVCRC